MFGKFLKLFSDEWYWKYESFKNGVHASSVEGGIEEDQLVVRCRTGINTEVIEANLTESEHGSGLVIRVHRDLAFLNVENAVLAQLNVDVSEWESEPTIENYSTGPTSGEAEIRWDRSE